MVTAFAICVVLATSVTVPDGDDSYGDERKKRKRNKVNREQKKACRAQPNRAPRGIRGMSASPM